jgi:hypothetical protein
VPSQTRTFELAVPPSQARLAAGKALAELGWSSDLAANIVHVREDPVKLCCGESPVSATIRFAPADVGTRVQMEFSVPGFGPRPKRQLADRTAGLEQRISRWAAAQRRRIRAAEHGDGKGPLKRWAT